ncbi:hypothetical protein [Umezawaea beigongshangensis]|uniref:hypothetical protein n=1 Tax=Umezawaea beigongshangensis TaxID=2780383 RepID=UPI0018F1944B|nr:hypothetical protein [Umezawaea beigongshangensis]
MTSVADVKAALELACEHMRDSYRSVREAQQALDEAVEILGEAGSNHHESLLPPEFTRAGERFGELLELMVRSLEAAQRLSGEL